MARYHHLTARARTLRRDSTDAEQKLWTALRNRQLAGLKFRRQVEIDGFLVDFVCLERRLIIEVDGGQHMPGRDRRRTVHLEGQGYRILRFWNDEVLQNLDGVWTTIEAELMMPPHPPR